MSVSRSFSFGDRERNLQRIKPFWVCCILNRQGWVYLVASVLMSSVLLVSCSGLSSGGSSAATVGSTSASSAVALTQLHWCGKPLMIFRDEGAPVSVTPASRTPTATATGTTTPTTVTNWTQVEPYLGFTVYLPPTLPQASCLTSASGTIHDPILGGSFTIGYLLPDHSSVSLSEAPLRSQNTTFQCILSPSSTAAGSRSGSKGGTPKATPGKAEASMQVCTGAHDTTRIVFSARGTTDVLQRFFASLQPHIKWIPAS